MKKTLAYINPDCYFETDVTVLKYLARHYRVIWYPVYYTDRSIYYSPEQLQDYAKLYDIEIHLCPRLYRQRDLRNYGFYDRIVKDINAHDADLVFSCISEEIYWALAARKLKAKRIIGIHDVVKHSLTHRMKRMIQGWIHNFTIVHSDCHCVYSEYQRTKFLARYGKDCYNLGMSCKDFGSSSLKPGRIADRCDLLFFGGIMRYKGLDILITKIEELHERGIDNLHLTIAGDGEDREACKALIKIPELYDLHLRFIDNSEIPDLMCSSHFLVLPYRDVTQSGPLMIAANYSLPIIAPAMGSFTELYDAGSAILYDSLEDALKKAASLSEQEYALMRNNAALLRERCSEQVVAERYINYFNSLLEA